MLSGQGLDLWADSYDHAVWLSDEDGSCPARLNLNRFPAAPGF